jgi:signal transduction histidine kinase
MAKTNEKDRLQLIELSAENIRNSINEIKNISKALLPAMVVDLGLMYSINDLIENLKLANSINVEFYTDGDCEEDLQDSQKLMLFRIIQEQVKNVIEHARAKNLIIEMFLSEDDKSIELNISDDGNGFDPETTKKGLGFSNIISRVDLFEGDLKLVTQPGEGCKLRIWIPIQPMQSINNLSFT